MRLKRLLPHVSAIVCLALAPFSAAAEPATFIGLTVAFGGGSGAKTGITAKILSSDEQEKWVAAAGVSYYFTTDEGWGFDLSAGYNFDNVGVLAGYDFLQRTPVASIGWADTKEEAASLPPS